MGLLALGCELICWNPTAVLDEEFVVFIKVATGVIVLGSNWNQVVDILDETRLLTDALLQALGLERVILARKRFA